MAGQYRFNPDTGKTYLVGSKASERPVKEQQANLLEWAEDQEKLAQWQEAQKEEEESKGDESRVV